VSDQTVLGIFHGGITVSDMDRALEFYRDFLGLELLYDRETTAPYLGEMIGLESPDLRIAFLRTGPGDEGYIELLEYRSIERRLVGHAPWDPGSGHICFSVVDVDRLYAELLRSGYTARSAPVDIVSGPNTGSRAVYVSDPDGHWVELFQRPVRRGQPA
jgi:catechol 2,3-dioxygenase-like lactoylglutathione lyase family enzyme